MKFIATSIFGLVATAAALDCATSDNQCRVGPDANQASCSASLAQCQATCKSAYDSCRVQPMANMASCASSYAGCLGMNPFSNNGTNTVTPVVAPIVASTTALAPATTANATVNACSTKYDACRGAPDANRAACAAEYAGCLGSNPFASNGTNTVTPAADGGVVYTTEVVTSFTTYCPAPTTLVFNQKTYTISSATTLTITDCPCTLTHPVPTAPAVPTTAYWNATTSTGQTWNASTKTSEVHSASTTYISKETTLTIGSSTYTVSKPTTIVYSASTSTPATQHTNTPTGSNATPTGPVYTGAASRWTVGGSSVLLAGLALLV